MKSKVFSSLREQAQRKADARGSLEILYESSGVVLKRSFSKRGVFRGLHWQAPPHEQAKLIRVVSGRIADFVIDMRAVAHTLHWRTIEPADEWVGIDACYAHGFYALEDTVFEYICDGAYNEAAERSFSIAKVLERSFRIYQPQLSAKDAAAAPLRVDRLVPDARIFAECE